MPKSRRSRGAASSAAASSSAKEQAAIRIKVTSIGDGAVGKSCIIKRYCEERFVKKYVSTIGVDFGVKPVSVSGTPVKVNFWDLSGQPEFFEVRNEFYKDTQGAILVYDCTSRASFKAMEACDAMLCNVIWCNVKGVNLAVATTTVASDATHATMQLDSWLKEAEKYGAGKDEVVFTVCANKVDEKNRLVSQEDGENWAQQHGFEYYETSAKTGQNVAEMFESMFAKVVRKMRVTGRDLSVNKRGAN